ncbi:MAG: type II toxin-antitoxin system prevent-host-death family antitoxin [Longimicrobiales bacterium]|nr:type II toxin-antitoxin system prevent-host-death family antitoxin [Longimicrobiales bacterium]
MRYVPVEEARKKLGALLREAQAGETVLLGRRGTDQAVLLSAEEYERLRRVEEDAARARLEAALTAIAADVRRARLAPRVVEEAVRAARRR